MSGERDREVETGTDSEGKGERKREGEGEGTSPSFGSCCADLYQLPITHFLLGESFHPGGVDLTRQLANQCLIGRESHVLDLACGRGATSLFLAQEFACRVSAVDLGEDNLAALDDAALQQGVGERIETTRCSVDSLPFPEDTFDAVVCECALCTFTHPEAALAEISRVLKPTGRLGLSDICLNHELPERLTGTLSRMMCLAGARSTSDYRSLLEASTFSRVRSQSVSWAMTAMLDRIEKQLTLVERIQVSQTTHGKEALEAPEIPEELRTADLGWLEEGMETLSEVRSFVESGGLGYVMMTARPSKITQDPPDPVHDGRDETEEH